MSPPEIVALRNYLGPELKGRTISDARYSGSLTDVLRWRSRSFARLKDDLGVDPFTIAEDAAFPSTVGEFVRAYENVPA